MYVHTYIHMYIYVYIYIYANCPPPPKDPPFAVVVEPAASDAENCDARQTKHMRNMQQTSQTSALCLFAILFCSHARRFR